MAIDLRACILLSAVLLGAACSGTEPAGEPAGESQPVAPPLAIEPAEPVEEPPPGAPETPPEATPVTPPIAPSEPAPAPPAENLSAVVDPGGVVEVPAAKAGLTRIGAEKCKVCHKVQFASWSESAHARRDPPLDCEGCHGPGSEYKGMSVMKDPAKATAAGLVRPDEAFCSTCHTGVIPGDLLVSVLAHKEDS
jgi:hypothetical protein